MRPTARELIDRIGSTRMDLGDAQVLASRVEKVVFYCEQDKSPSEERRLLIRYLLHLLNGGGE